MANGDSPELMEYRLKLLEQMVGDVSSSLLGIKDSLHTLAETRDAMTRAFKAIADMDTRLLKIEQSMPVLTLTSGWVRTGVVCLCGLVLVAVAKLVIGG